MILNKKGYGTGKVKLLHQASCMNISAKYNHKTTRRGEEMPNISAGHVASDF